MFCTDTDLLRWEPALFAEAQFASQLLLSASCSIAGTTLTLGGTASFTASRVRAGHVASITGTAITGCYPIVAIGNATTATLSIVHEGLDATPIETAPIIDTAASLHIAVRTFAPQRLIVSELLSRMCGLAPYSSANVINADVLRKPCVLGTLQMIYNAMAAAATSDNADLFIRAELYERLYRKSLRGLVAEIDTNGDGVADAQRHLRLVQFIRV